MPTSRDAARHTIGTEIDDHTERLEHVDRTALRRRGATAMLGDLRTRSRGDDRSHGGHVDRAGAVATSAAGVDERYVDVAEVDPVGELEHGAHERRELTRGLALRSQSDGEGRDLGVGRVTGEHDRHGLRDQVVGKVLAPKQAPDDIGPQRWIHPPDATESDPDERRGETVCAQRRLSGSGGLAALADQAAAFPLVEAAPHALLLPGGDGVLEAGFPHRAHRAHGLGLE